MAATFSGTCEAEVDGEVMKQYFRGDFFGELALENYGTRRGARVRATHEDGVKLYKLGRTSIRTCMVHSSSCVALA